MILFLDCKAGASGDMLLAAMVDLGLPVREVKQALSALGLNGVRLQAKRVRVDGQRVVTVRLARRADRLLPRQARELIALVRRSALRPDVKKAVVSVLQNLTRAEAQVHGTPSPRVQFHQLAGADMLAAVAGFCIALSRFRIRAVYTTPVPLGEWHTGHHGRWTRRPGPATLRLLRRLPRVIRAGRFEWTTPTAAVLLASFAEPVPPPPLRVERIGRAAGHHTPPSGPRVLTALLGYPLG